MSQEVANQAGSVPDRLQLRLTLVASGLRSDPVARRLGITESKLSGYFTGRLDLTVLLPDQARLDSERTTARVRVDDSRISFDPLQAIPPGGQRSFEITYRLPAGGTGRASAILSSTELDGTVERSCQTTFLDP